MLTARLVSLMTVSAMEKRDTIMEHFAERMNPNGNNRGNKRGANSIGSLQQQYPAQNSNSPAPGQRGYGSAPGGNDSGGPVSGQSGPQYG